MSKAESVLEEDDYSHTRATSPSTSVASSIEIEDMEQIQQLTQPIESQSSRENLATLTELSESSESLKDIQTRMINTESHLLTAEGKVGKLQLVVDEIKVATSQTGFSRLVGSKIDGDFVNFRPGLNPQPQKQNRLRLQKCLNRQMHLLTS